MGIEQIANKYGRAPEKVWANTELDELRRKECLCMNCDRKNEPIPYASCPVAGTLYDLCVINQMSIAVTKCGAVDGDGELMYRPLKD